MPPLQARARSSSRPRGQGCTRSRRWLSRRVTSDDLTTVYEPDLGCLLQYRARLGAPHLSDRLAELRRASSHDEISLFCSHSSREYARAYSRASRFKCSSLQTGRTIFRFPARRRQHVVSWQPRRQPSLSRTVSPRASHPARCTEALWRPRRRGSSPTVYSLWRSKALGADLFPFLNLRGPSHERAIIVQPDFPRSRRGAQGHPVGRQLQRAQRLVRRRRLCPRQAVADERPSRGRAVRLEARTRQRRAGNRQVAGRRTRTRCFAHHVRSRRAVGCQRNRCADPNSRSLSSTP